MSVRSHRVLVPGVAAGEQVISGSEATHLVRVLRVKAGQQVVAFDGKGLEALGQVVDASDGRVVLHLADPVPGEVEASLRLTLAVALLKGDRLADVVRQGTELGVARFRPLITRYSDVRVLSQAKLDRLRRVAREASKQSGRALVPEVDAAVTLDSFDAAGAVAYADPRAATTLAELVVTDSLTVITGPEGGLSLEEVGRLEALGATGLQLGRRILRAETAPVAIAAALLAARGD